MVESTCVRTIGTVSGELRCDVHPDRPFPWRPVRGCRLPVAQLCGVCARVQVPIEHRFSWSYLCRGCAAVDDALGRRHGATSLTPYRGQTHTEAGTVFARVLPDQAATTTTTVRESADGRPYRHHVTTPGTYRWIERLSAHSTATVTALASAAGLSGTVTWSVWETANPVTARVRAEAYRAYLDAVHPWALAVEPRAQDVAWLTRLAASV